MKTQWYQGEIRIVIASTGVLGQPLPAPDEQFISLKKPLQEPHKLEESRAVPAPGVKFWHPTLPPKAGNAVALSPNGRKAFYQAYEARMDTLVSHPLFDYRLSYRRMLDAQTRLLAKYIEGSVPEYPVSITR